MKKNAPVGELGGGGERYSLCSHHCSTKGQTIPPN